MFEKKNTVKKDSQFTQETNLAYLLNQTLMTLDEAGKEFSDEHTKLELLAERLTNELLNLAVLGQFKRGKSTFINALLGKELLPSAVIPLTAIPTFLHWGLKLSVTIFELCMLKFYVWVEISNVENIILMSLVLVYNEYLLKLVHNNVAFATRITSSK